MKDSQGNEFGINDELGSKLRTPPHIEIRCQDIKGNIATMVWIDKRARVGSTPPFDINQEKLLSSFWVKIQKD